jgi:hypothetical protein
MGDVFNVTAAWDKASYNAGDTITGTIAGSDVVTTTTTTQGTIGPVMIPVIAPDGATTTMPIAAVPFTTTTTTTTPESVVIDTTRPIVDSGTVKRNWKVSPNLLSITAVA